MTQVDGSLPAMWESQMPPTWDSQVPLMWETQMKAGFDLDSIFASLALAVRQAQVARAGHTEHPRGPSSVCHLDCLL